MVQLIPPQWKSQVYFGILKTAQSHIIKALLHSFRSGFRNAPATCREFIYEFMYQVNYLVRCLIG